MHFKTTERDEFFLPITYFKGYLIPDWSITNAKFPCGRMKI